MAELDGRFLHFSPFSSLYGDPSNEMSLNSSRNFQVYNQWVTKSVEFRRDLSLINNMDRNAS